MFYKEQEIFFFFKDKRRKWNRREFCNKAGPSVIYRLRVIDRAELNISL